MSFGVDMQPMQPIQPPYYIDRYGQQVDRFGRPVRVAPTPAPHLLPRVRYNHQPQQYQIQHPKNPTKETETPALSVLKNLKLEEAMHLQYLAQQPMELLTDLQGKIEYLEFSLEQAGIQVRQYPEAITSTRDRNYTDRYGEVLEQV